MGQSGVRLELGVGGSAPGPDAVGGLAGQPVVVVGLVQVPVHGDPVILDQPSAQLQVENGVQAQNGGQHDVGDAVLARLLGAGFKRLRGGDDVRELGPLVLVGDDQPVVLGQLEGRLAEDPLVIGDRRKVGGSPELGVIIALELDVGVEPDLVLLERTGEIESQVPVIFDRERVLGPSGRCSPRRKREWSRRSLRRGGCSRRTW